MTETLVLAGDVGGTHARVAFFARAHGGAHGGELREAWSRSYASPDFAGLPEIARRLVADSGLRPGAATFGVAGPVVDGRCRTTNLPWEVDARDVASALGIAGVALLNDLEANAWGLAALPPESLAVLLPGAADARGTQALIAAGTGLGEAFLAWDGARHVVGPSEGGHASFSPLDDDEDALLLHLRRRLGHVSWERVLSGPGLVEIAQFLDATSRELMPAELRDRIAAEGAEAVTSAASAGVPVAVRSLRMFARLYGAEAGNLALKVLAMGGVFVGGGIAPKIRPWLEGPDFAESFLSKGRMRHVLERIPVRIVLDDRAALLGAARHAALHVP